jgi:hypothetical protein
LILHRLAPNIALPFFLLCNAWRYLRLVVVAKLIYFMDALSQNHLAGFAVARRTLL